MTRRRLLLEGPFSREWYFGERVARQSLRSAEFIIPQAPPIGIRYTDSLDRAQIQRFRKGFRATDSLEEGDYSAFVSTFLMRPLFGPMPTPTPKRHDEAGPSRAVPDEDSGDALTEEDWRVTVTDIYGDQFTHHFQPAPEVDSSRRPVEVSTNSSVQILIIFCVLTSCNFQGRRRGLRAFVRSVHSWIRGREAQWFRAVPAAVAGRMVSFSIKISSVSATVILELILFAFSRVAPLCYVGRTWRLPGDLLAIQMIRPHLHRGL